MKEMEAVTYAQVLTQSCASLETNDMDAEDLNQLRAITIPKPRKKMGASMSLGTNGLVVAALSQARVAINLTALRNSWALILWTDKDV
eukprot:CAMPEP_0114569240 /NCGR_PEP_ID=MMETSP0114-20121206/16513_1 /TAXON_ID=31324 /ORGANISM="Goniomonas sp, Strain m" /LENGTH=87 /DNA_ID=CAMNT_0001756091 /DNA_START=41 /DNA_END=301 /DNA_ORIENTATION=+